RFQRGAGGKPELAHEGGPAALRFNLSHGGDLALIALARGRELGVDIEPLRALSDEARLARRVLSPREADAFAALPPDERAAALLRCWTRKEALLKANGCGITVP